MAPCSPSVLVTVCLAITICAAEKGSEAFGNDVGCQHWSTSGRDYRGKANTTTSGIPCQNWSDTKPHDHEFTHVGDHNFCRNPAGSETYQVWCYTNGTDLEWDNCSVPFCPPLKVLDFSLDNDWKPNANANYTHASLQKENLPPRSPSALLLWWNSGEHMQTFPCFTSWTTTIIHGCMLKLVPRPTLQNSQYSYLVKFSP